MRRHLPLASASAVVLVVATLSLTVTNTARAQVRSTIGVTAEVVETGPALAADRLVRQAVARAFELPQPEDPFGVADLGRRMAPRVTVVRQSPPAYRSPEAFALAGLISRTLDAVGGSRGSDIASPPPDGSTLSETGLVAPRIVVYVEHISN